MIRTVKLLLLLLSCCYIGLPVLSTYRGPLKGLIGENSRNPKSGKFGFFHHMDDYNAPIGGKCSHRIPRQFPHQASQSWSNRFKCVSSQKGDSFPIHALFLKMCLVLGVLSIRRRKYERHGAHAQCCFCIMCSGKRVPCAMVSVYHSQWCMCTTACWT